jgi:CxxC-x17-CxxC domain-containing protein
MQKKNFQIKCFDCGKIDTVPFKPTTGRRVFCRSCFSKNKSKNMFQKKESLDLNFSFNPNQAWARRGNDWKGKKEDKPLNIFKQS